MKEALYNAGQELKRVDHLFYVSLKYTRTADMMRHMIERLISTFSFGIDSLLKYAKEEKKIDEIPSNPMMRSKLLMETFTDEEFASYMNLYLKLRKILKADYSRREEFRRHVTMTCTLDKGEVTEVNIDILKEYYETAKNFVDYVERIVEGKEEDE
ncbi:MAG: hypothetical protein QF655_02570 [Candidatus Woesearchaeota archaeon]|jgi:hypothetical protein|nr:hypothetical protein [Candidatus Woesearchaeota archaeon]MDP7322798.1 hypothetical protein [Candidatus Woesearchaeota archaeon]MDP7476487.1 hypothetical protein [Candidatus Woesearchaeota archaeon]HJO01405.1 hypothetical protein [Candidatus Woesearchaeota archaeon]|tara:strand:- start:318 stop:785 length:468 start_codon:yes stop_codon:yes gene_type:complete